MGQEINHQIKIPENLAVQCLYCGDTLNSALGGVYHRGTAWFKQSRNKRTGTNAACLLDWSNDWACDSCMHKLLTKIPVSQLELFPYKANDD